MRLYYVEVWNDGMEYEAGKAGAVIKVRASSLDHAETKAFRDYEVSCGIGLVSTREVRARKHES